VTSRRCRKAEAGDGVIRLISYRKAILAGMAGALAWEALARLMILAGLPFYDVVRLLGALAPNPDHGLLWWPIGLAIHLMAGALWAIFYAYFFWSVLQRPPVQQGLAFSVGPALLTIFIVHPQLQLMQSAAYPPAGYSGLFGLSGGWAGPLTILVAHAVYGSVMGALYTRPVGAPVGERRMPTVHAASPTGNSREPSDDGLSEFMFATGIECSYPTLEGGRWRVDEMAMCGHYRHWRQDLELVRSLGIKYLRYGPPLHEIYLGPGRYDWSFMDGVAADMQRLGIRPIIDFCHFGVPDWLENFQNPHFPEAMAAYAGAFAERYPWIGHYTPINEMYVCARLSALEGLWNEQCKDERSFVTAARHLAKAAVLITRAVRRHRPDAIFVNNESSEFYQACCPDPDIRRMADFENQRRFIPLDLLYARPVRDDVRDFLFDHGMPKDEYDWFLRQDVPERTILGVDYYDWNEKVIEADGQARALGELFGWYVIISQYFRRYQRMVMHTETNYRNPRGSALWLWRQWHNVQRLREAGVPVVGFTWYSLTDQLDWDIAVSAPIGNVTPVGLFDLNRDLRSVGLAYKQLIEMYRDHVPVAPQWGELRDAPRVVPEPGRDEAAS
jgi:beta-glucosidase/6-phospho-beta-glucosidase/beta-galactosidase